MTAIFISVTATWILVVIDIGCIYTYLLDRGVQEPVQSLGQAGLVISYLNVEETLEDS